MNKIYFKKLIFFSIIFFGFFFLFQTYINTASMDYDDDYYKEIEKIKALSPSEGYEAYMKLKRDQNFSTNSTGGIISSDGISSSGTGVVTHSEGTTSSGTGANYDNVGKTYNTGKIEYESWFDEEGNEYEGNQKNSFQYYGTDAYCAGLDANEEKICRAKHAFWNPGTFKMLGNLVIGGLNLMFNNVDSSGINWIMTGIYEPIYNTLGFDKNNQALVFGHNVYVEKNLKMNNDNSNSVFLRAKNSGEKIVQTNNDILIYNSGVNVFKVLDDDTEYKVNVSAGLEVEDYLKTEQIIFQSSMLEYCDLQRSGAAILDQQCELPEDSARMHTSNFIHK